MDTWIGPEENAYTCRGAQVRHGRAVWDIDGKLRAFRAGIPDTYFSIPAHGWYHGKYARGFVYSKDGDLHFHTYLT